MELIVQIDPKTYGEALTVLSGIKDGMKRALRPAVAKSATTVRARASRLVISRLNLRSALVKKMIHVRFTGKDSEPGASVRISGKLNSLRHFKPVQNEQGVEVKVWKGEGPKTYKHSFMVGKGWKAHDKRKRGLFARIFKRKPQISIRELSEGIAFSRQSQRNEKQIGSVSKRLPLHRLLGPSAADAADKDKPALEAIAKDMGDVLEKKLLSQVDRLIAGQKLATEEAFFEARFGTEAE